jgi:septum formation protein
MKVILASGSPRRRELLTQAGIDYEVCPADIEENTNETLPSKVVEDLSRQKAMAVASEHKGQIVLAADTVVAFDDKILGKPADEDDAFNMLTELSGRTHQVYTGVTIVDVNGNVNTFSECTDVTMYENSSEAIRAYIASKEPMDKAGAYGIQGLGAILVEKISGDYNNVVGLPLARVYRELYNK